jgi:hypothetical protein
LRNFDHLGGFSGLSTRVPHLLRIIDDLVIRCRPQIVLTDAPYASLPSYRFIDTARDDRKSLHPQLWLSWHRFHRPQLSKPVAVGHNTGQYFRVLAFDDGDGTNVRSSSTSW